MLDEVAASIPLDACPEDIVKDIASLAKDINTWQERKKTNALNPCCDCYKAMRSPIAYQFMQKYDSATLEEIDRMATCKCKELAAVGWEQLQHQETIRLNFRSRAENLVTRLFEIGVGGFLAEVDSMEDSNVTEKQD